MKEKLLKKGLKNRLLSVVLALVMVLTLMPINNIAVQAAVVLEYGEKLEASDGSDVSGSYFRIQATKFNDHSEWDWDSEHDIVITSLDPNKKIGKIMFGEIDGASGEFELATSQITCSAGGSASYHYNEEMFSDEITISGINASSVTLKSGYASSLYPNYVEIYYISHKHTWDYTRDGEKLTATSICFEDEACSYYGTYGTSVEISLSAKDVSYSGKTVSASIKDPNNEWATTVGELPTIKYYTDEVCVTPTSVAGNGASKEGGAPSAAGKYWAAITAGEAPNAVTAKKSFTIKAPEFLRFTAVDAGAKMSYKWTYSANIKMRASSTEVLKNGTPVTSTDWIWYNKDDIITFPSAGDYVEFKGNVERNSYYTINNGRIAASGDITSLSNNEGGDKALPGTSCFASLFRDCTALTTAPNLPSTTLTESCYNGMFSGCTSLTSAPELPATTLAYYCYKGMFNGCTGLTTTPELPATTLKMSCYDSMFYNCSALTTAKDLPATTIEMSAYQFMFQNCTSLTKAPAMPATTVKSAGCQMMFSGCTSLITAPELPATMVENNSYGNMFYGCTALKNAPTKLPATTLAQSCYGSMFRGCTSLTSVPELPATTLVDSCYSGMFMDCTSLTSVPELPATTLAQSCYGNMFRGCTSLTSAPELPATTLVDSCYIGMFMGCKNLIDAPELKATTLATKCYANMFNGCTNLKADETLDLDAATWIFPAEEQTDWNKDTISGWPAQGDITEVQAGKMYAISHLHIHNLNYVEADDAIKVYCTESDGAEYCEHQGTASDLSKAAVLTLKADDATYSATDSYTGASLENYSEFSAISGLESEPEITYYKVATEGATTGGTLTSAANVRKTVGNYYAKITVTGTESGLPVSAVKTFKVDKIDPVVGDFEYTAPSDLDYDGNAKTVTVVAKSGKTTGTITVKYYDSDNAEVTSPTDAGTYKVKITVTESDYYKAITTPLQVGTFTINKVTYTGTDTASGSLLAKNGKTVTVHLPELPAGASYGVAVNSNTSFFTVGTVSDGKITVTSAKDWDAETEMESKTFTVPVTGATNYEDYDVTVTITPTFHSHSWEYSVVGTSTLKAHCKNSGHSGSDLTLTLSVTSKSYDGTSLEAVFGEGEVDRWEETLETDAPTITYEYKTTADGTYAAATEIKNSGYYRASATVDTNKTATIEFQIYKLSQTAPEVGEGFTVDYIEETFTIDTDYEVSTSNTSLVAPIDGVVVPGTVYYVRKKEKINHNPSPWTANEMPERPAAPTTCQITNVVGIGGNNGKISGVDETMEYSTDAGLTWEDVTGTEITELKAGMVLVRVKATETSFAGTAENLVVNETAGEKGNLDVASKFSIITGKNITVTWGKVKGADGYDIYMAYCGKSSVKLVKSAKASETKAVIKKLNGKAINQKNHVKCYVVAYKMECGEKVKIAKTITGHAVGKKNGTVTDAKALKLTKTSYSIKKGKTAKIKATTVKVNKKLKLLPKSHAPEFRYSTTNKKIATVSSSGTIKAIAKGNCYIYVYAVNGLAKKVKVTVK